MLAALPPDHIGFICSNFAVYQRQSILQHCMGHVDWVHHEQREQDEIWLAFPPPEWKATAGAFQKCQQCGENPRCTKWQGEPKSPPEKLCRMQSIKDASRWAMRARCGCLLTGVWCIALRPCFTYPPHSADRITCFQWASGKLQLSPCTRGGKGKQVSSR